MAAKSRGRKATPAKAPPKKRLPALPPPGVPRERKPATGHTELGAPGFAKMVSEAAYYRAERRGFEPGHELEDWLAAEKEIRQLAKAAA